MFGVKRSRVARAAVAAVVAGLATGSAQAAIYWSNYGCNGSGTMIARANLDGSKANQSFFSGASGPVGVAVDSKYLYWDDTLNSSCAGTTIGRIKIDGTAPNSTFIKGVNCAHGIAVNGSYIYWANRGPGGTGTSLGRARLNGTGVNVNFITGATGPWGVAINHGYIYWTNRGTREALLAAARSAERG